MNGLIYFGEHGGGISGVSKRRSYLKEKAPIPLQSPTPISCLVTDLQAFFTAVRPSLHIRASTGANVFKDGTSERHVADGEGDLYDPVKSAVMLICVQKRHLLSLPPELRNRIWREVVIEDITFDAANIHPKAPGLVRTGRQARREAIGVYFLECEHFFHIVDYDGAWRVQTIHEVCCIVASAIDIGAISRRDVTSCSTCETTGLPNWANLVNWVRVNHAAGLGFLPQCESGDWVNVKAGDKVMTVAMSVVEGMEDEPWEKVEGIREDVHRAVAALDAAWA